MSMFMTVFTAFPFFMPKSESLLSLFAPLIFLKSWRSDLLLSLFALSLFFKEQQERFAIIALYKKATVSESLPSLITKEQL